MQCQFCGTICDNRDELQIHQVGSCPAIENEVFEKPSPCETVFSWVKDRCLQDRLVHVVLSDFDSQIKLYSEEASGKYESDVVAILPGKYAGQIIMGTEMHTIKDICVNQNNAHVVIEVQNNGGCDRELILAKDGPNQMQIKLAEEGKTTNEVRVNYELNKKVALTKKMSACEKEDYEVELQTTCCNVQLNTASFEYFKEDVIEYINSSNQYRMLRHDPVKDINGCVTGEIMGVGSKSQHTVKLFTINIYQTTSRAMINGSKYQIFVENDLPLLLQKLRNRKTTIREVNKQFKNSIPKAMSMLENCVSANVSVNQVTQNNVGLHNMISKRERKKRTYEGYDTNVLQKRNRNTVSTMPSVEKLHVSHESVGNENHWEVQPKYWEKYSDAEWNKDVAKNRNKRKGCLAECGKNNSREMIRCDGCGRWCHFRCIEEEIDENEDFICSICEISEKSVNIAQQLTNVENISPTNEQFQVLDVVPVMEVENQNHEEIGSDNIKQDHDIDVLTIEQLLCQLISGVEGDEVTKKINMEGIVTTDLVVTKNVNAVSKEEFKAPVLVKTTEVLETVYGCVTNRMIGSPNLVSPATDIVGAQAQNRQECSENILFDSLDNDESITLGMQFKNKKFMIKMDNILKGKSTQEDVLYGVVMKLKEKLSLLEVESQQGIIKKTEMLKIQALTKKLESSERKLEEIKEKYKKVVVENKELKKEKKDNNVMNSAALNELRELKRVLCQKDKSIIGLHEKVELARVTEIRLNAKLEMMEAMTFTDEPGMKVINPDDIDRSAEKISTIRELEEMIKVKDDNIHLSGEKLNKVKKELTVAKDQLAEKDTYIKNVDNMYAEIINRKNKTIEYFTQVTDADDEMAKGFKRLLMKTLAEKEVQNIKELYMEMKCKNASVQAERSDIQMEDKLAMLDKDDSSQEVFNEDVAVSTHGRMPELEDISNVEACGDSTLSSKVKESIHNSTNTSHDVKGKLVTLRVINLPTDMDVKAVVKLFNIETGGARNACEVVIDKINNHRIIVKIVTLECIASGILQFDQTMLHRRKIRVFVVDKCRLGVECARKVCRFGHEERFKNRVQHDVLDLSKSEDGNQKQHNALEHEIPKFTKAGNDSQRLDRVSQEVNNKELSLWKIRNLPEKMNAAGMIRLITNLGVVVEEVRSLYQVLTIKSYGSSSGMKVEAVLSMTEEMGQRLLSHSGLEVGGGNIEISRTKKCRFRSKCVNLGKNCSFYHEKDANSEISISGEQQTDESVPLCWFQKSCPFGKRCKFTHPGKANEQGVGNSNDANRVRQVKNC